VAQRVVEYHLARLKDKRPAVRLDAVQQLLLLKADVPTETFLEAYVGEDDSEVLKAIRQHLTEFYIPRLKATNDDVRRDAIQRLVSIDAVDALEALQEVYKSDSDEEIRKDAQKAGRTLWDVKKRQG
jgi:HEAT repeat protein